MFLMKVFGFCLLLGLSQCQTTTVTFATLPDATNLGACVCDLTLDACDVNCCCDPKCSSADKAAFTVCIDELIASEIYNKKLCVPRSQIFTTNTPYIIESFQDLLCLSLDNYASLNYYQQPPALTQVQFLQLANLVVPASQAKTQSALFYQFQTSKYKANDPLWTLSNQNTIGYFAMPNDLGENCGINSPSTFLSSRSSLCRYKNLVNRCNPTELFLSHNFFSASRTFLKNANSIAECVKKFNTSDPAFSYNQNCADFLLQMNKPSCKLADGTINADCTGLLQNLAPAGTTECTNLVKAVKYTVTYENSTSLVTVDVNIELTKASLIEPFTQTFTIDFVSSTTPSTRSYKRSGNPGYLIGEPVVAGKFVNSTSPIVFNSVDRSKWFTIPKQAFDGTCNINADRASIKFGKNLASDCKIVKPIASLDCQALQNEIVELIRDQSANRPTHAARFGNTGLSEIGDWIEIKNRDLDFVSTGDNVYKGICNSMVTSATLNVAYANAGDVSNPQPMIVYLAYEWGTPERVAYSCVGQTCSNNLEIRVTTKVTFIDVSKPPEYIESKIMKPQLKLPENFFYPFILNTNNGNFVNKTALLINSFALIVFSIFFQ